MRTPEPPRVHAALADRVYASAMADGLEKRRTIAAAVAAHGGAALLLGWVALANGFPLLFSDSGTYLRIGTELYFPADRPVTYGLMLLPLTRLFGSAGLWAAVLAQGLFAAWMIGRVVRLACGRCTPAMLVAVAALLAAASSLPWFTGQLMPDVFTGFVGLAVFLLVFGGRVIGKVESALLVLVLAGLVAVHLSHLAIAAALVPISAVAAHMIKVPLRGAIRAAIGLTDGDAAAKPDTPAKPNATKDGTNDVVMDDAPEVALNGVHAAMSQRLENCAR